MSDWKTLFFNPAGRIGRQEFWLGVMIAFVGSLVLSFIPVVGLAAPLLGLYVSVCVYAKRLHDMGRTGWLVLAPLVVNVLCMIVAAAMFGGGLLAAANGAAVPISWGAMFAGMGGAFIIMSVGALVSLAFMLWVGLTPGQRGPNLHGPQPGALKPLELP